MITFHIQPNGSPSLTPLIMLHGFMGSNREWDVMLPQLTSDFYCLPIDLPGHGKTICETDDDYSMPACAEQLVQELLNRYPSTSYNLLGYSMGGRLAFYLLTQYPDLFGRAVIISSTPGLRSEQEQAERKQKDSFLANRLMMEPYEQFLDDWYAQPLFTSLAAKPDLLSKTKESKKNNNPDELQKSLRFMGTGSMPSQWDNLGKIKIKLHLIAGENDPKFIAINDSIVSVVPDTTFTIVSDAGHTVHLEQPDRCVELVKICNIK